MPFRDLVGHRPVVDLLRLAVARDRVPQSLLLAGPDGVGKRAVAIALAQAVNCPARRDGDACGRCPTCVRIAGGRHSDVVFLDQGEEASIKIDALRARVLDLVGYRPFEAMRRVFIIDPAHLLAPPAQDALLKTLEEPPPATLLVLVTPRPDRLAPTVLSRCRRLRFGPLSEADVAQVLVDRGGMDASRARVLAAVSGGSVGAARAAEGHVLSDDRAAALDLITAAASPSRGVPGRLEAATALAKHGTPRRDREAVGARLTFLASLLRDLAALTAGAAGPLVNDDLESSLRPLASRYPLTRLSAAHVATNEAQRWLDRQASPKLVADWVGLTI